jgi:hypothetical protein
MARRRQLGKDFMRKAGHRCRIMPAAKQAHKQALVNLKTMQSKHTCGGKARGAYDRFGVPAYEGVGPSRFAARAQM